jgi:hypothetical protein
MSYNDSKSSDLIWSRRVLSKEKLIAIGHTSRELHGSNSKLGTKYHIILTPVTRSLKEFLIKLNRLINKREYVFLLFLSIRQKFRIKVDSNLDRKNFWVIETQVRKVSSNKTIQISTHRLSLIKFPDLGI